MAGALTVVGGRAGVTTAPDPSSSLGHESRLEKDVAWTSV
jgi:hypothetical protein